MCPWLLEMKEMQDPVVERFQVCWLGIGGESENFGFRLRHGTRQRSLPSPTTGQASHKNSKEARGQTTSLQLLKTKNYQNL